MMKVLPIFALAIAVLAASHADAAEIYKWKDASGKVVFGSSPPPGVDVEKTGQQTGSGADGEAQNAPDLRKRLDAVDDNEKVRLKGATLARHNERVLQREQILCEQAKQQQNTLKFAPRLTKYDDQGNKSFYSKEERDARAKSAEDQVIRYCGEQE